MNQTDFSVMVIGMLFKLVVALLAFSGVRFAISNMDKAFSINVKGWLNDATDQAKATYFGLRLCAVCLLFGLVFAY